MATKKQPKTRARSASAARKSAQPRGKLFRFVNLTAAAPERLISGSWTLVRDPHRLAVTVARAPSERDLLRFLKDQGLRREDAGKRRTNGGDEWLWLVSAQGPLDAARLKQVANAAKGWAQAVLPAYRRTDVTDLAGVYALRGGGVAVSPGKRGDEVVAQTAERMGYRVTCRRAKGSSLVFLARRDGQPITPEEVPHLAAALTDGESNVILDLVPLLAAQSAFTVFDAPDDDYASADATIETGLQWNLRRVHARIAWGTTRGNGATCYVVDRGVKGNHGEFTYAGTPAFGRLTQYSRSNIAPLAGDLSAESSDGAALAPGDAHGTQITGVLAAGHGSGAGSGIAGLAPEAQIISLYPDGVGALGVLDVTWGVERAAADSVARALKGVVLLGVNPGAIDVGAINLVSGSNQLVIVCPSGPPGTAVLTLPDDTNFVVCTSTAKTNLVSSNPPVSLSETGYDTIKPDGGAGDEGGRKGADVSLGAPGELIRTSSTSPAYVTITGTSVAAAHVAGLAALVRAAAPALTATQVRRQLITSAAKTGDRDAALGGLYTTKVGYGLRCDGLGYGRVDGVAVPLAASAATHAANLIIRDNPTDEGAIPSTGWWVSDCVVKQTPTFPVTLPSTTVVTIGDAVHNVQTTTQGSDLDAAFSQTRDDYAGSTTLNKAGANYLFIRVKNKGPQDAIGLTASAIIAAVATSFAYPSTWDLTADTADALVASLASPQDGYLRGPLPPEGVAIFRLTLTAAQSAKLAMGGFSGIHGCFLARVVGCNDTEYTLSTEVGGSGDIRSFQNNITQRNLSVV